MQNQPFVPQTHIIVFLDCSGSMDAVREATVRGFNEQVQTVKSRAEQTDMEDTTFYTLILFSDFVTTAAFVEPVLRLKQLREDTYRPRGGTAMLDAVGTTMVRLERVIHDTDETAYLVIIISDGEENSSREYTYKKIARMISRRQTSGRWTFRYMGANQDLSKVERALSLPMHSACTFVSSRDGISNGFTDLSCAVSNFVSGRSTYTRSREDFYKQGQGSLLFDDDDGEIPRKRVLH